MVREFKKRELGNVTFKGQIRPDDIKAFIKAFIDASFSQEPYNTIQEKMANVRNIDVGILKKVVEDDSLDVRKMVKRPTSMLFHLRRESSIRSSQAKR